MSYESAYEETIRLYADRDNGCDGDSRFARCRCGPQILGRGEEARIGVAKTQLRNISSALDLYKLDNFNYPSTDQGLEALVSKPSGSPEAKNWNKNGYLPSVPKDPWGVEYQYISPGSAGPYDLYSLGADQREGGGEEGADISINDLN